MNIYRILINNILSGVFKNIEIALIALAFWLSGDDSMTVANLSDILSRVGYTFDTTTHVLSDGTNTFTIYQGLTMAISDEYKNSMMLNTPLIKLIVNQAYIKSFITAEEKATLISSL